MGNYDEPIQELLNGVLVDMSPRPTVNHNIVVTNITSIFRQYLKGKSCIAFGDGVEVTLTETDLVVPDSMIVCNRDSIKRNGVYGAPDLIVEVLSPSTAKRDKGYKKELYERCGIKEYWIVDPRAKGIEIYSLQNNRYILSGSYTLYSEEELSEMGNEEREIAVQSFHSPLYEDLVVSLGEIFDKTL